MSLSITYRIDTDASIVRVKLSGTLQSNEIEQTVAALLSDSAFQPGLNILSDHVALRDIASTDMVHGIIPLLRQLGERAGSCRCAVVVSRDVSYGMARMAAVYAQRTPVAVRAFRSGAEAESWLQAGPDA
jgi:hypothetical protein